MEKRCAVDGHAWSPLVREWVVPLELLSQTTYAGWLLQRGHHIGQFIAKWDGTPGPIRVGIGPEWVAICVFRFAWSGTNLLALPAFPHGGPRLRLHRGRTGQFVVSTRPGVEDIVKHRSLEWCLYAGATSRRSGNERQQHGPLRNRCCKSMHGPGDCQNKLYVVPSC